MGRDALATEAPHVGKAAAEDCSGAEIGTFRRLYVEHFDRVWRFLARMGVPPSDVEDLVQEVFVVVHRKLPGFDGRVPFTTWLLAIALRQARNYRRWRWRHRVGRLVGWLPSASAVDPEDAFERKEAATELAWILDRMGDKKRAVFLLYEIEGLDGPAISQVLGCSVHTVWSRLRLARDEFGRLMRRRRTLRGEEWRE